jgi:hydrogenase maturation protein HypF
MAADPYECGGAGTSDERCAAEVDFRPVIRQIAVDLATGASPGTISRRFHSGVVAMIVAQCEAHRRAHGVTQVVLSGGVFLNEFLVVNSLVGLRRAGFDAYAHRLVPANDGGIALGQVMVAGARLRSGVQASRTMEGGPGA